MTTDRIVHGRYRVVNCIGRGGMGAVYEAIDERLRIRVALKESFAREGELRDQFGREARLLASLRHPALPRVTDYFIEGDRSFLIMEYVAGPTLAGVLKFQEGKPFDRGQVVKWADQVLDVLVYLHSQDRGVIHRDIKPQNLKLTPAGGICLIDFGLAKARSDEGRSLHGFTRRYAPIEQIEDRGTTEQSDIYALGATLYHLLTGVKPADAEVRARVTSAGGADPLVSGHILFPAIGVELSSLLDRALSQRPEERFCSALEFREALRKTGRVDGEESNGSCEVIQSSKSGRVRRFAIAACLLMAIAVLGLLLRPSNKPGAASPALTSALASVNEPAEKRQKVESSPSKAGGGRRVAVKAIKRVIRSVKVQPSRAAHVRVEVVKAADKSRWRKVALLAKARTTVKSDEVLRAPDGTEVVKFRDGRVRAFQAGERR